jgi:nicotinamidase-related amidase
VSTALLLIDIQNDYFPGGAMELVGSVEAGAKASQLLGIFREKSLPVIHIQHLATRPGATFFLPDTQGVQINGCVSPNSGETVIQKNFPNCFRGTPLLEHLRSEKITKLVIAGMMTHMCVDTTVRAAADLGFQNILAHDACATRDLSFDGRAVSAQGVQTAYLAAIHGSFAEVKGVDEICANI